MDRFRRSVAALTGLFFLQLTLLGGGTACALRHGVAKSEAADHAQRTMAHQTSAHETIVTSSESSARTDPIGCNGTADRDDCRLPLAPRQCSSMTTCDVTATAAAIINELVRVQTTDLALPSPTETPSGPSFAPELPPPRV
jgi:hypothetical protein